MHHFTVLAVDDNEPFRRLVCSMLESRTDLQVIGEASDGLEAIQKAKELQPDLILLDIGLPKVNGIEATPQIRQVSPRSQVIFVSQENSLDVAQAALDTGAMGYIYKPRANSDLLRAIDAVLGDQHFIGSGLKSREGVHTYERLYEIGASLTRVNKLPDLLHAILDAAIELTGADFGNIQIRKQKTGKLKMMAHRGVGPAFVKFFDNVHDANCGCGMALKNRTRVVVEDVSASPIFSDIESRTVMLNADARACQSTPLFDRTGELFGILNTHYRRPYRFSDGTLQLLDLIAQQAGDLIQHLQVLE
jgi:CheY-like chemotaxis protein